MSYAIPSHYDEPYLEQAAVQQDLVFVPRSKLQWIPFLFPLLLTGISWMGGGTPALTDMGFTVFTILCGAYLIAEFLNFPRRFGIGGLVLWGGVLCWFCQDYFTHWFHRDFQDSPMPAVIIAKAAFLHVCFVMLMSVGLSIDRGIWAEKLLLIVPDPGDDRFYLNVMLALAAFGISPYFLFNGPDQPWYSCMAHAMFAGWIGPPHFDVYRTGNLNYSWGGYVAQIMQVGEVSGIVSIVYTILIAPTLMLRLLGASIWTFYALVAFESGRRGNVAFNVLPPIALLFIKYQAKAAAAFRTFSPKAFLICGALTVGMQFLVQFQGTFRDSGFANANLSQLSLTANQGNTMFSEGLLGYAMIPDVRPFVYSADFPGEGFIVAMPKTVFDLVIGIIPRALWHDKPVDELWEWYNNVYQGTGREGTTISKGLVGSWYFKYGIGGLVEGGILMGWLMGLAERGLQHSEGKPIHILFSLAFATWLFRTYRDFIFIDLYGLILGAICLYFLIPLMRPILGGSTMQQ
jgi:hypothetical protein